MVGKSKLDIVGLSLCHDPLTPLNIRDPLESWTHIDYTSDSVLFTKHWLYLKTYWAAYLAAWASCALAMFFCFFHLNPPRENGLIWACFKTQNMTTVRWTILIADSKLVKKSLKCQICFTNVGLFHLRSCFQQCKRDFIIMFTASLLPIINLS